MGKFYNPKFEKINTMPSDNKEIKLADRHNKGKLEWSLVHMPSLEPLVRVLEFGAKKYARDNWKKGLSFNKIKESLMRHMIDFFDNMEDNDAESGINHIGHMMANCMFLQYMFNNKKDMDDRQSNP